MILAQHTSNTASIFQRPFTTLAVCATVGQRASREQPVRLVARRKDDSVPAGNEGSEEGWVTVIL
jgi:hypothetical protein